MAREKYHHPMTSGWVGQAVRLSTGRRPVAAGFQPSTGETACPTRVLPLPAIWQGKPECWLLLSAWWGRQEFLSLVPRRQRPHGRGEARGSLGALLLFGGPLEHQ